MKVVYAPNYHCIDNLERRLYLSGGVAGCPDWQSEMIKSLEKTSLIIFNPRRQFLLTNMPEVVQAQREWELGYIRLASAVAFWFPKESLCPSTNFELGLLSTKYRYAQAIEIFVGIHPDHTRHDDILTQVEILHPDVKVVPSIKALAQQIKNALKKGEIDEKA